MPPQRNFKVCYCLQYGCRPEQFVEAVFYRCLPPKVVPVARLIRFLRPEFFVGDFDLIESAGAAKDCQAISQEIAQFLLQSSYRKSLWHNRLGLRVSTSRLEALASQCLNERGITGTGR